MCFLTSARKLFGGDIVGVLGGDHHRVDALRACRPTYSTLTWLLPSGRRKLSTPARRTSLKLAAQLVRQHDGQRHQFRRLVAGVAEHQALVAGAAGIHAHGDVGRLALDRVQHAAGLGVEADARHRCSRCRR